MCHAEAEYIISKSLRPDLYFRLHCITAPGNIQTEDADNFTVSASL